MKKSLWIAVALAVVLFIYGFVMSYEWDEQSTRHHGSHATETTT